MKGLSKNRPLTLHNDPYKKHWRYLYNYDCSTTTASRGKLCIMYGFPFVTQHSKLGNFFCVLLNRASLDNLCLSVCYSTKPVCAICLRVCYPTKPPWANYSLLCYTTQPLWVKLFLLCAATLPVIFLFISL